MLAIASGSATPSRSVSCRSSSWSRIEPAAALEPKQRASEARTLLVGPVDEPHRQRRRALGGDAPQHLDAGHHVQAAVEPAAVRHRVDVTADQERALGRARQREPLVPGLVDLVLGEVQLPAQPFARPLPTSPSRRRAGRRSRRRSARGARAARRRCDAWLERHLLDSTAPRAPVPWASPRRGSVLGAPGRVLERAGDETARRQAQASCPGAIRQPSPEPSSGAVPSSCAMKRRRSAAASQRSGQGVASAPPTAPPHRRHARRAHRTGRG